MDITARVLRPLFNLSRKRKRIIQLLADVFLIAFSFLGAMLLRLDSWEVLTEGRTWLVLLVMTPVSLAIFIRLGFYRSVIRYMNQKAVRAICAGVLASAVSLAVTSFIFNLPVPRSVPFIYAMLALLTIGGVRFGLRAMYLQSQVRHKTRVVVYGAGDAGRQLVASLQQGREYVAVAFIDDESVLHGAFIDGVKVYKASELGRLIKEFGAEKVLLAMPSATRCRRRELLESLERLNVVVQTIPGMADVVSGRAKISELRDVSVEDLLGRDPVPAEKSLLEKNITGKVVMVSGAGGSIGSELCRQILRQSPKTLVLFDIAEYSLYNIEQELLGIVESENLAVNIKAIIGSVQHRQCVQSAISCFRVQTVYHAAAYKHVPMVESNVIEGLRNNVFGTLEVARAAAGCGVESFVLISTDKAVRPTNVMGASKRLAELVCQAMAERGTDTCFSMVRFGNVLGSSGSVVPLFRRQIEQGGPITVTHPDITRYFMTIPEAAQLVIQAGAMASGGDVFVLDMGEPVKIVELAAQMVRLSGLEPRVVISEKSDNKLGDIDIVFTGLRPGEKLYEELLIGKQSCETFHPRIKVANEPFWEWPRLDEYLAELFILCAKREYSAIREMLINSPVDYNPSDEIVDLVWLEDQGDFQHRRDGGMVHDQSQEAEKTKKLHLITSR